MIFQGRINRVAKGPHLAAAILIAVVSAFAESWNSGPTTAPFWMYPNQESTRIGIGLTSNPTAQLQVSTLGSQVATDANLARFGYRTSSGRAVEMSVDYRGSSLGDGSLVLREDRSGKDFMLVNLLPSQDKVVFPNGKLGVGVETPAAQFHFKRDGIVSPSPVMLIQGNAGGNNALKALVLSHGNTPAAGNLGQALEMDFTMEGPAGTQVQAAQFKVGKEADFEGVNTDVDAYLAMGTTYDGTLRERLRINANGNIGVGTSSPASMSNRSRTLEISAAGVAANAHPSIVLRSGTTFSSMPAWEMLLSSGSTGLHTDFQLCSGGTGRMIVSGQTGNVGIGEVSSDPIDGVLKVQRVDWTGPMVLVQGNAGGNNTLQALTLRHNNTPYSGQLGQAIEVNFTMEGPNGSQYNAAKIRAGKESDFYGGVGNVDSYLAFHTTQDGNSVERARITADGTFKVPGAFEVGSVKTKVWSVVPDYVFDKDYELTSLDYVEKFIEKNKHLPEVPSAKQFKETGMDLAAMNFLLLKKVEELTLHAIRQEKEMTRLADEIMAFKSQLRNRSMSGR